MRSILPARPRWKQEKEHPKDLPDLRRYGVVVGPCYYPAFLNLQGVPCVVVGGGKVAERKVLSLLRSGARITVISPALTSALVKLEAAGKIRHKSRNYRNGDVKDAFLVIAATADEETNKKISEAAACLVNVADGQELANFIVPAVANRGGLSIAVSTSGASPALARSIRKEIEALYGRDVAGFLTFLRGLRAESQQGIPDRETRERFLKEAGSPEILSLLRVEGAGKAREAVLKKFRSATGGLKQKRAPKATKEKRRV